MLNLIKRDFGVMRLSIILIALYGILFSLTQLFAAALVGVLGTYVVVYGTFGVEERDKIDLLNRSLPVTAKEVVGSKYAEGFIAWVIVSLFSVFGTWIAYILGLRGEIQADMLRALPSVLMATFAVSMLLMSVTIPVIYKFGYIKSRTIVIILWLILALSLPTILTILGGADAFFEYGLPENIAFAALVLLALAAMAVSYAISLRLYKLA